MMSFIYNSSSDIALRYSAKFLRNLYEQVLDDNQAESKIFGFDFDGIASVYDFIDEDLQWVRQLSEKNIKYSYCLRVFKSDIIIWDQKSDTSTIDSSPVTLHEGFGRHSLKLADNSYNDQSEISDVLEYLRLYSPNTHREDKAEHNLDKLTHSKKRDRILILSLSSLHDVGKIRNYEITSVPEIESINIIPSLRILNWDHESAELWKSRERHWPLKDLVNIVTSQEVYVAPAVEVFKSNNFEGSWLLDFSVSESYLLESLDLNHRKALILCLSLSREIFQFTEHLPRATWINRILTLHSFFWMLDKHDCPDIQSPDVALDFIQTFLKMVKDFFSSSFFPHFFLPDVNLLSLINLPAESYTHSLNYQISEKFFTELHGKLFNKTESKVGDKIIRSIYLMNQIEDSLRLVVRQMVARLHACDSIDECILAHQELIKRLRNLPETTDYSPLEKIKYYVESSLGRLYCVKASSLPAEAPLSAGENIDDIKSKLKTKFGTELIVDSEKLKSLSKHECLKRSHLHTLNAVEGLPNSTSCCANLVLSLQASKVLPESKILDYLLKFLKGRNGYLCKSKQVTKSSVADDVDAGFVKVDNTAKVSNGEAEMEESWQIIDMADKTSLRSFLEELSARFYGKLDNFDVLFSRLDCKILPSSLTSISDLVCQDLGCSSYPLAALQSLFLCRYLAVTALTAAGRKDTALEIIEDILRDMHVRPLPGELEDRVWPVYFNSVAGLYDKLGEKEKALELLTRSRKLFPSPRNRAGWLIIRNKLVGFSKKGLVCVVGILIAIWATRLLRSSE